MLAVKRAVLFFSPQYSQENVMAKFMINLKRVLNTKQRTPHVKENRFFFFKLTNKTDQFILKKTQTTVRFKARVTSHLRNLKDIAGNGHIYHSQ